MSAKVENVLLSITQFTTAAPAVLSIPDVPANTTITSKCKDG